MEGKAFLRRWLFEERLEGLEGVSHAATTGGKQYLLEREQ